MPFLPGAGKNYVRSGGETTVRANPRGQGEKERTRFLFSGVEILSLALMTANDDWNESVGGALAGGQP